MARTVTDLAKLLEVMVGDKAADQKVRDPDLGKDSKRLEENRVSRKSQTSELPSLHHRKEGWPSDQENAAKPPLIARPGWFSE